MKLPVIVLAALLFAGLPLASSNAYVGVSVAIAPPAIPVYAQPYCPAPGYLWTPGYWAWNGYDYYWVPGVWVAPPRVGFLWTPGYWGYNNGLYAFNDGYWGPTVGFYGGINYGFGYGGRGYYGGRWVGETFSYNTAVTRVNPAVITKASTYRAPVKVVGSRAGFNGPGGAKAKPTAQEQTAAKAEHVQATSEQRARVDAAKNNPDLAAKNNHGKPKAAAINAVDNKNGQQAATTGAGSKAAANETRAEKRAGATKQAATEKSTNTTKQAHAEKATDRAVKTTDRSTAKSHRTAEASTPRAHKVTQPSHKGEVRKVSSAPRTTQHAPTVSHRPQPVKSQHAAPAPRGGGPAGQGPQDNKKKKKGAKEKPNGG